MFFKKEIPYFRPLLSSVFCIMSTFSSVKAHFLEIIPKTELVSAKTGATLPLSLQFTHPARGGPLMDLALEKFGVQIFEPGRESINQDLLSNLTEQKVAGKRAYQINYPVKKPGNYLFYAIQAPYWEVEEGIWIQQSAKVIIDAFDAMSGWQQEVGMTAEIVPLTRPYGLWAGQVFTGIVKHYGKSVAFAPIEIEYSDDRSQDYPGEAFVSQQVMTDANGVFTIGLPKAGWWGFAALLEGQEPKASPSGEAARVEHGAVLWVRTRQIKQSE